MRADILINDDDIAFINGDFSVGESDAQHVEHIVIAYPGEFKKWPQLGFSAISYIKRNIRPEEFKRDLKLQLEFDGYLNPDIDLSNGFPLMTTKDLSGGRWRSIVTELIWFLNGGDNVRELKNYT
ncbi:MAG: thymidylate synthase, partial [Flavobacteriaceae bacterium]|nr:thymidylate synthase [Flavobacteriaceae bacterium]